MTAVSQIQYIEAFALLGAAAILLVILGHLVKVYNYDYDGNPEFRGWAYILALEDTFFVPLPKRIIRKACTDEYVFVLRRVLPGMQRDTSVVVSGNGRRGGTTLDIMFEVTL